MKIQYIGTYPVEVGNPGPVRKPGDVFEVNDPAVAADLLRREQMFKAVESPDDPDNE
jgi:hypothetical protein